MSKSTIGRLTIDIMAKTAGIEKGTREGRKKFRDLEKTVKKVEKAIETSMKVAGAATVGYAAVVAKLTISNIDLIASQKTLADALGGTVTGLRAVNAAAGDKSIDDLDGSLNRLNRRLGAVENGGGPAAAAVKALGLSTEALAKADVDEKLAIIADRIKATGISSQQAARYLQDLGFEQKGIVELFKDGGDSLREYRAQIEATGRAVSDIEAIQIQEADKAFKALGDSFEGIKTQLAVQLGPLVGALAKAFNDWSADSVNAADDVSSALNATIDAVAFTADALHGLKATGEVGFIMLEQAARALIIAVLGIAEGIVNGPIYALNGLIDLANKLPGVSIEAAGKFTDAFTDTIGALVNDMGDGFSEINDILLEPLPGESIKKWAKDAQDEARKVAEAIAASKTGNVTDAVDTSDEEAEKYLEDLQKRLDAELEILAAYGLTEDELIAEQLARREELLRESLANELLNKDEFDAAMLQAHQEFSDKMGAIDKARFDAQLKVAQTALGNLSTLMNSSSRKAFEVGKAAAIANTVVNTAMAAMSSYNSLSGIPIIGPVLGAAAAVAAVAAGAVQIQNIKKTKFGSGSAGAATSNTAAVNAAAEPVQGANAPQQKIYMQGIKRDELYDGAQLLDVMNKQIESGGRLVGYG